MELHTNHLNCEPAALTVVTETNINVQQTHLHALSRVVRVLASKQVDDKLKCLDASLAMKKQPKLEGRREGERQTDRQTDRKRDRERDRQSGTVREKERERDQPTLSHQGIGRLGSDDVFVMKATKSQQH